VGATSECGSVKIAVTGLHQTGIRIGTVMAIRERIKRRQCATSGDPENRAVAVGTAFIGGSIKIAVIGLDQTGFRIGAVMTIGEGIKRREASIGGDPENRAVE